MVFKLFLRGLLMTLTIMIFDNGVQGQNRGDKIGIGVVFAQNTDEIQNAFKFAMMQYSIHANSSRRLEFQAYVDIINTADSFKLSRLICNHFGRGVWSMLGAVTPDSFDTLHSYTNTFQMPFVTPWFPEKVRPPSSGLIDHAVSIRPAYHGAVFDIIRFYGWKNVIYMYDSNDGLLRLQQLYTTLQPGNAAFHITHVKRIANASDAVAFLAVLDRLDRWANKYVVLDTSTRLAKDVLIGHVRDPLLGRRNFHYFLSGLVMDDTWEKDTLELFSINVTGFKVLDLSRKYVQDFMELWKKEFGSGTMSAQAALMYDAVQVLIDSLVRLQKKKPEIFRTSVRRAAQQNTSKIMDCNPAKGKVITFEHGDKISRLIKKTELEGLSGDIQFNEEGHRNNFSLQVVEMTLDGSMTQIGTWYDDKGFVPMIAKLHPLNIIGMYDRNKTYIVTTILETPYLMRQVPNYSDKSLRNFRGFCKDLTEIIAQKLNIKVEMRLVLDGSFGNVDPSSPGGWNGMIGELMRKEADMAIASLTMSSERQSVVDFSIPFLSLDQPDGRTSKFNPGIFSFLRPLSKEVWISVGFSMFGVSAVLYIVSKYSSQEWRFMAYSDSPTDHNEVTAGPAKTTIVNEYSFWNAFWFTLGSFMQQGSEVSPRNISGRIISAAWWFFTLILISIYTANMASYLTATRMSEPASYNRVTSCSKDNIDDILALTAMPQDKPDLGWKAALQAMYEKATGAGDIPDGSIEKKCEMVISLSDTGFKEFAVAFPKQSNLREGVNLAIQSLKDDGEMMKLVKKWFLGRECDSVIDRTVHGQELTLSQVAGLFYVLLAGLALSLGVALFEFCSQGRTEAARDNVPLHSALRTKVRQTSGERKSSPSRSPQHEPERPGWNGANYAGFYTAANQIGQEETALNASFTQV